MAAIAGLYGGGFSANQEDGSGGRSGFFRGFRTTATEKNKADHTGGRTAAGYGGDNALQTTNINDE
jgi:hypothetical protein